MSKADFEDVNCAIIARRAWGRSSLLWLAAAAGFSMNAGAITADAPEFRNLADGVFAYIRKRNDANAMVIVTSEGVVLVDTGNSNSDSRALLNDVRSMPNEPVRHVASSKSRRSCGRHALFSPPAHVILQHRVAKSSAAKPISRSNHRTLVKAGVRLSGPYVVPEGVSPALGYDALEITVTP